MPYGVALLVDVFFPVSNASRLCRDGKINYSSDLSRKRKVVNRSPAGVREEDGLESAFIRVGRKY